MANKRNTQTGSASNWTLIEITEPIAGLDPLHEQDCARYADETAESLLGPCRLVAADDLGLEAHLRRTLPPIRDQLERKPGDARARVHRRDEPGPRLTLLRVVMLRWL
jgi:hypothetical protein